jgi:hypothetical protein
MSILKNWDEKLIKNGEIEDMCPKLYIGRTKND